MNTTDKPDAPRDDNDIWGNTCLPVVLESLGKSINEIKAVVLRFNYGEVATATFFHRNGQQTQEVLPIYSLDDAAALGTPRGLTAFALDITEGNFVTVECRYFPLGATAKDIVALLKDWAEATANL